MSCKHPTLNDNPSLIPTRGLIYVAKVLNVFYIGKGLSVFFADTACRVPTGWLCPCIGGCVFFWGGLLYFRGCFFLTHLGAIFEVS